MRRGVSRLLARPPVRVSSCYSLAMKLRLLVVVLLCLSCKKVVRAETIYLLALLPYYNPEPSLNPPWHGGDDIQPALELAKDQINNSSTLLQNHTLELVHAEGGCDSGLVTVTTVSLVRELFNPTRDKVTGIIGPGCSASTVGLAPLINRTDLSLVMVHGAGSPVLKDRHTYRFAFGTLGTTENFVQAFTYLANKANWTKVALLWDDSGFFFQTTATLLHGRLEEENVTVDFASPVSSTRLPLDAIADSFIRVTFVLCRVQISRRLLCIAYNKNMIFKSYQWIFMDQTLQQLQQPPGEFMYEGELYNCSKSDMIAALNGSFFMIYGLTPVISNSQPVSNTTYFEYLQKYEHYRNLYNNQIPDRPRKSNYTYWATYLYDAVWAWAKVLDALTRRGDFEVTKPDYSNMTRTQMIANQFYNISFQGMSGEIKFSRDSGFRHPVVNLSQVRDGCEVSIAFIVGAGDIVNETYSELILDHFEIKVSRENLVVSVVFTMIALIQLGITVSLHVITVKNSAKPSVRASNTKLLHLSYVGIYTLVMAILLYQLLSIPLIIPKIKCWFTLVTWAWLFPIGFTLAFAPVAMRTWRFYRIFVHYLDPGRAISNVALFGAIVFLLMVDMILAIAWTSLDPFTPKKDIRLSSENEALTKIDCTCKYYETWISLIIIHKQLLLIAIAILAFLTRKIPNRSFSTDTLIVLSCATFVTFNLGFSLYYIMFKFYFDPNGKFAILLFLLSLLVTVFVLCVLTPPVTPIILAKSSKFKSTCSAMWQSQDTRSTVFQSQDTGTRRRMFSDNSQTKLM